MQEVYLMIQRENVHYTLSPQAQFFLLKVEITLNLVEKT